MGVVDTMTDIDPMGIGNNLLTIIYRNNCISVEQKVSDIHLLQKGLNADEYLQLDLGYAKCEVPIDEDDLSFQGNDLIIYYHGRIINSFPNENCKAILVKTSSYNRIIKEIRWIRR